MVRPAPSAVTKPQLIKLIHFEGKAISNESSLLLSVNKLIAHCWQMRHTVSQSLLANQNHACSPCTCGWHSMALELLLYPPELMLQSYHETTSWGAT